MKITFLIAAGLAAATHAQTAADGFEYIGCVQADSSVFNVVVDFVEPFSAEKCQNACTSFGYAALGG